ncbi:hypothetical protein P154DRAFT_582993 [Amniculicola lignicola CBS 123094]|uniref:Uncharacterized protein n=1 Tax=Amniculicola lignicola CBS 123094 TaxID=1392246 RepID=A0A6A5VUS4_9PLEO|nr:hypothetical protein P154DRAFT_582993 [Amniculicola lignicola CBS 123094]
MERSVKPTAKTDISTPLIRPSIPPSPHRHHQHLARTWNKVARDYNSNITDAEAPLAPLVHPDTNKTIKDFPFHAESVNSLPDVELDRLLVALKCAPPAARNNKIRVLWTLFGLVLEEEEEEEKA